MKFVIKKANVWGGVMVASTKALKGVASKMFNVIRVMVRIVLWLFSKDYGRDFSTF